MIINDYLTDSIMQKMKLNGFYYHLHIFIGCIIRRRPNLINLIQLPLPYNFIITARMLQTLQLQSIKVASTLQSTTVSTKKASYCQQLRQQTQPSTDQFKSSVKLNPQKETVIVFQPSNFEKLLMLPVPFLMIGCCKSMTTVLEFFTEKKYIRITSYPGFFKCCKKQYEVSFQDVLSSKMMVAFNQRINKRQAYQLYLETLIGDFELTPPKNREETISSKNKLDDMLKFSGAWHE